MAISVMTDADDIIFFTMCTIIFRIRFEIRWQRCFFF